MAKDIKRRFTVDLEISLGDAEKKVKATAGNIKTILADLGNASDKMTYFKELADYLSQVDAELARFKQKHGEGFFNQIFGGLDAGLRKELEDTFGVARAELAQLEAIRSEFEALKTKGATADELKPLEQKLKSLYDALGRLDEAKITGRGTLETRLQKMEDALDNFAVVWDGVNGKISQGFHFGSASGGRANSPVEAVGQFSDEVQKEIDRLNKQIQELRDAKNQLLDIYKIAHKVENEARGASAIPDSYVPELTIESVKQLIDEFKSLKAVLDSSDKSSADYYVNLLKASEAALKLQKANSGIKADASLKQLFIDSDMSKPLSLAWAKTHDIIKEVLGLKTLRSKTIQPIDDMIQSLLSKIESAKTEIGVSAPLVDEDIVGDVDSIRKKINDLENELNRLQKVKELFQEIENDRKRVFDEDTILDDDVASRHTSESLHQLIKDYRAAEAAKNKFEAAGDISSDKYYKNLANMSKIALELQTVYDTMENDFEDMLEQTKVGRGTLLASFDNVAGDIRLFFENSFASASGTIDKMIAESTARLQSLRAELKSVEGQGVSGHTSKPGGRATGTGSGSGTGASGTITNVDFTDLKDTIKSEASVLAGKLDEVLKVELVKDDTKNIQDSIDGIKATIDKISMTIDNYNSLKETSAKQAEVEVMKNNLTQLLNFITKHNSNQTEQELKAMLMSDKTISIDYGEEGHVTGKTKLQTLLSNLTSSLIADIHSHPVSWNGSMSYMNDMFSGSKGDLRGTKFGKKIGAKITSMITGNIMRTFDLTKLTSSQLAQFVTELSKVEKRYMTDPKYAQYVGSENGELRRYRSPSLEHAHKTTEVFEQMMYDALKAIGISKDKVNSDIFHKFNLTDNDQLTQAAMYLVDMANSAQQAISPLERLKDILSSLGADVESEKAKTWFTAFNKGELTAAEVFNRLNPYGYNVSQDTIDSMFKIDSAGDLSAVDALLTNINNVLDTISSSVSNIESNTARSTTDKFDTAMNDIVDLRNGITSNRLTAGVKSIFDPLNISEYKSKEVLRQSDESVLAFKDLLHDAYRQSMSDGKANIEVLEVVLDRFKVALSNVNDAMKQIHLYESRTGEDVYDHNGEFATNLLSQQYGELIDSTNLEALLYMLSQAKLDIGQFKNAHDGGFASDVYDGNVENIDLVIAGLNQIQSTLDSIYSVLRGFTGIEASAKNSLNYREPVANTAVTSREFSEHDLSVLESILQAIRDIDGHLYTNRSDDITEKNDSDNTQNSELINLIRSKLPQQLATEDTLQAIKSVVDSIYTNLSQTEIKPEAGNVSDEQSQESSIYQLLASKLPQNVASEDTLSAIRDILGQLIDVVKTNNEDIKKDDTSKVQESLSQLVTSLTSAVKGLQDVANGIVKDQKVKKSNTNVANARISDKNEHDRIRDIALNSLGDRALDSDVTEMKALANGIVKVIGYLQVAENEWEGFTVQINEAGEASNLAFDKNAKAAKQAAAAAEALRKASESGTLDDNPYKYNRAEVEARAQVHLDEYTAQGKNATVQFKDSGRYTISILEEIGGLSKQIFQTFDENDEKIERTTITMSNKALVKLQELQKIAEFGQVMGFVGDGDDAYNKYGEAAAELERLNELYRQQDSLTDEDIASWNTQIKLVQRLGSEVEKLVLRRKTAASNELFSSKKDAQVSAFDKYRKQLQESILIPNSFISRLNNVRDALKNAVDNDSLQIAKNNWSALRNEIEKTAIEQDLYIKKTNTAGTTSRKAYGTTPVVNAQKKFNELNVRAQPYVDSDSAVVQNALKKYKDSLEDLIALQKTFKVGQEPSSEELNRFIKLKVKCDDYGKSLKKIIDSSDKLRSNGINEKEILNDVPLDSVDNRAKALRDYVQEVYRGKATIQGFNGDATALTFTLKKADGTIENMTASLNAARTAILSTSQGTKQATSIFDSLGSKFKELWTYAAARFGIDEIFQTIRTGVQYVRDIDSALTELKKVTNETDGAYDNFLQNMSKTAGVVGSTVADLTTMAAEWSRLGYSMEESATLAKNTAILLNVSEFDDATEASEALISTMQAFQYTADESGHVVDILNEIGNNYAVSSDGIAVALQDSASALMEGGNSLEQATALVAAANKVVQDPNSVGKMALPTLKVAITVKS